MRVKNVLDYKLLIQIFNITRQTWNNWKKENRLIVTLIEKYFTKEDLEEFLQTGKITKFDNYKTYMEQDKDFQLFCKFKEFMKQNDS
ncbi:MAG: hypothetical protein WC253_03340 [Sulfurovaceae bacterium]